MSDSTLPGQPGSAPDSARHLAEVARVRVTEEGFPQVCLTRAKAIASLFGGNGLSLVDQTTILAVQLWDHDRDVTQPLRTLIDTVIADECSTDRAIREMVKALGIDVDGDDHGVPPLEEVVREAIDVLRGSASS